MRKIVTTLLLGSLLVGFAAESQAQRRGTSILHYSVGSDFVSSGALSNAVGEVRLSQNRQGRADNQRVQVVVSNLEPNVTYQAYAVTNADGTLVLVGDFVANAEGTAVLHFKKNGASRGRGRGPAKFAMPEVFNPVTQVLQVHILTADSQPVLQADMTDPEHLKYLVKRSLENAGVEPSASAHLHLKASTGDDDNGEVTVENEYRVRAVKLTPSATYSLAMNGGVVDTQTSDNKGRLEFRGTILDPVLQVREISILNADSTVIFSATLP